MTRIASRHSGRRTSPASRRSRLKSDIGVHYCISRFTMQEQILQLSSTIKPRGATSPLPATPTRNRRNAKIKLSAKTAQYRNQISTLLGVPPLKFQMFRQPAECHQHLDSPPKAPPTPTPQPPTAYFLKSSYYHFLNHYAYPAMLNVIMALYPSYLKQDTSSGRSRSI